MSLAAAGRLIDTWVANGQAPPEIEALGRLAGPGGGARPARHSRCSVTEKALDVFSGVEAI